jgi:hypothetical protein
MGQDAASVGQSYQNALYLAIGRAFTSNWWFSGVSDDQLIAKGAAVYAANPNIIQFPRDATAPTPPNFVVSNPGTGVEAPNVEIPFTKNADGSSSGRIPGTSVVVNLPKATA